jgi:hypothetical protein
MTRRIAASLSLIAFAVCLVMGGFQAENSFSTSVQRALVAMVITLIVGLAVGAMAQKMLDENIAQNMSGNVKLHEENPENSSTKPEQIDR